MSWFFTFVSWARGRVERSTVGGGVSGWEEKRGGEGRGKEGVITGLRGRAGGGGHF